MQVQLADESAFALHTLRAGLLSITVLPNGCIYAIESDGILINQVLASPLAGGIHRIYLRVREGGEWRFVPVVGPGGGSRFAASAEQYSWSGSWAGLDYQCICTLRADGFFFDVAVTNQSDRQIFCDAISVQDVGLSARGQVRNNELYNSQYLDHFAAAHADFGQVVMSRQNLAQGGKHPWLVQGCLPKAIGFCTDGIEFFGCEARLDGAAAALRRDVIGNRVRQYEMAYIALQSEPRELAPGTSATWTFFDHFLADHPARSTPQDLERIAPFLAQRNRAPAAQGFHTQPPGKTIFESATPLHAEDLGPDELDQYFGAERRHAESDYGQMFSFFCGDNSHHIVLRRKELSIARPHGHIMKSGRGLMPDDPSISLSCYAAGVFGSQLAFANPSLVKLLSGVRDPLNLLHTSGLRAFVRLANSDAWQLLAVPSAFEMRLDSCRWHYKLGDELLVATCSVDDDEPAVAYTFESRGSPAEFLITGEIACGPVEFDTKPSMSIDSSPDAREHGGAITITPAADSLIGRQQPDLSFRVATDDSAVIDAIGGDELLFSDHKRRNLPYFAIRTKPAGSFRFTISAGSRQRRTLRNPGRSSSSEVNSPSAAALSALVAGVKLTLPDSYDAAQLQDTLAWFARDALIHLAAPRGLEQPNGGAWGVRDVCQGSVEFLLSYDRTDAVAQIIRRVFTQQYHRRGDWPQWFMFRPYQSIQSTHCHGDVLIWPLKALCDYLEHTNDGSILDEKLPYTDDETFEPTAAEHTLLQHVDRAIDEMRGDFLPGVNLPCYGDGDWDDSLQPADPQLRDRMVSSWTAALMYQTLRRYAAAMSRFAQAQRAAQANQTADQIAADFQRHMLPDGIVAGFALFDSQTRPLEYLLHPRDRRTGLRYRLIPMTRGILSHLLTPEQAAAHVELLHEHLVYPDGARLMDRPSKYDGGIERVFRRSESAAFFGREVGLQYIHAHLRYAEAMAVMGRADELWRALLVASPIAVTEHVASARARQRNCYFSSSDAAFTDRYHAMRDYEELRRGEVSVDGGWRIYSSGPGIYTNIVLRHLLGLRRYFDRVVIDPVLPRQLAGIEVDLPFAGRAVRYRFTLSGSGQHPNVKVNGRAVAAAPCTNNPYRRRGVEIARSAFESALTAAQNEVLIEG